MIKLNNLEIHNLGIQKASTIQAILKEILELVLSDKLEDGLHTIRGNFASYKVAIANNTIIIDIKEVKA